jgi:hypothetical protein
VKETKNLSAIGGDRRVFPARAIVARSILFEISRDWRIPYSAKI